MARPWFKERASGLGWTPVSWEGWAITLGSMALAIAANLAVVARLTTGR